jgi:hypothetical protein
LDEVMRRELIPRAPGCRRPAALWPGTADRLVGKGIPGDVSKESVEPPGAARRIGTGHLHRIAYRRETALEPDPVVAHKVS